MNMTSAKDMFVDQIWVQDKTELEATLQDNMKQCFIDAMEEAIVHATPPKTQIRSLKAQACSAGILHDRLDLLYHEVGIRLLRDIDHMKAETFHDAVKDASVQTFEGSQLNA